MFANFLYFIIVLLIYATYQPPEKTNLSFTETITIFILLVLAFWLFTQFQFKKIEKKIHHHHFSQLDHRFNATVNRLCVLSILLFTVDIYGLNLPSFLAEIWIFSLVPTLQALLFLGLFIFYLAIVWGSAHNAYSKLYKADITQKAYITSNIYFSLPVVFPWLILSGVADIIFALPFELPKKILSTTSGEVLYFLVFLLIVAVFGPAMIQKFWQCKPLEQGYDRRRIEMLCKRAGLKFADILYWPIFGGRMITAGVMGLVQKFRYILVTNALLQYLEPEEIDAVMAHEIGHVKKKHIMFYLFFFAGYILLSYATFDFIIYLMIYAEPFFNFIHASGLNRTTITSIFVSLFIIIIFLAYFRFIFGYFMRNFERQADCYVYTLFNSAVPLITTLEKIAYTSGQPPDKPNWHHFSISERIDYLRKCETDTLWINRQDRKIIKSIGVYIAGMLVVGAVGYTLNYSQMGKRLNNHFFEKVLKQELQKEPKNSELYTMLGDIYFSRKNYKLASEAYETSIYLKPKNSQALNNLAWLYATCEEQRFHKPARALKLAEQAAVLESSPQVLDTLAESYYANRRYDKAILVAERALAKAKSDRNYFRKQLEKFKKAR